MTVLSNRTEPRSDPPYRTCAACGESEEDHGPNDRGYPYVRCRCDACMGTGDCSVCGGDCDHRCDICGGSGYSDNRYTEAVRP